MALFEILKTRSSERNLVVYVRSFRKYILILGWIKVQSKYWQKVYQITQTRRLNYDI